MYTVGIDYSLSSPGVCILGGDQPRFLFFSSKKKHLILDERFIRQDAPKKDAASLDFTRYNFLANGVVSFISKVIPSSESFAVFIEGYSYGSKGRVFEIGENQAVLISKIAKAWGGYPTRFAPAEIKKFATGNGNANKVKMVEAFQKETGIDLPMLFSEPSADKGPCSDIADAYWIARLGQEWTN